MVLYSGTTWPGFSVPPAFLNPATQDFWINELIRWYHDIPYNGIWIDLSEASSFCVGSWGAGNLDIKRDRLHIL